MNEEMIKELLEKLKQCDDFHNRCDFLMEHSEITYMLDYITNLQQENKELKEVIEKVIEYIDDWLFNVGGMGACMDYKDINEILDILKEVE